MIGRLRGVLAEVEADHCLIDCMGVGYVVACGARTLGRMPAPGDEVTLHIESSWSAENGPRLYGFLTRDEREAFRTLTGIQGVGPKAALSVLDVLPPGELAAAVAREDKAAEWFEAHATEWDDLRRRHSPDEKVEAALNRALGGEPLGELLDIGTGTGRMAELFVEGASRIVALDKSLEMLRVARAVGAQRPLRVVTSFLGAHAVPKGKTADAYIDEVCIPALGRP